MHSTIRRAGSGAAFALALAGAACSSSSNGTTPDDGGVDGATCGASLRPFVSPGTTAPNGQVLVTASGEALALGGYAFPPAATDSLAFVDGWEVKFTHLITTVDHVRLHANPDVSPADQAQTGALVAQVDGPWAIDLHKGGPLVGAGGSDEQAVPLAVLANQNRNGGAAFDTAVRYAFGFDAIAATTCAYDVNLDDEGRALYAEMVAKGWSVLYVGTATFKGTSCSSPTTSYDFAKLPKTVTFKLGFAAPTSYENCQNPDNPGSPFASEEAQRGLQVKSGTFVRAQVTFHAEHPFWESVEHDTPMHFDMFAARKLGAATADVTLDDLTGIDPTNVTDGSGTALPWRTCIPSYVARSGTLAFDPTTVPVNPSAPADKAIRDLRDFVTYNASTEGHLNSDGLCAVVRQYPAPR